MFCILELIPWCIGFAWCRNMKAIHCPNRSWPQALRADAFLLFFFTESLKKQTWFFPQCARRLHHNLLGPTCPCICLVWRGIAACLLARKATSEQNFESNSLTRDSLRPSEANSKDQFLQSTGLCTNDLTALFFAPSCQPWLHVFHPTRAFTVF